MFCRAAAFWRVVAIDGTSLEPDSSSTGQRFSFHAHLWKRRGPVPKDSALQLPRGGSGRLRRRRHRARRGFAPTARALLTRRRRCDRRVVRGGRRARARAEPVPLRKAEEQQDQHQHGEDRGRNARARAASVACLDDLTPSGTPVPPDAVPARSEKYGEYQNHEQDEKQSSQTSNLLEIMYGPGLEP